jgi:multidrug efflux pump
MNISAPFIHRPVATTLLTVAIAPSPAPSRSRCCRSRRCRRWTFRPSRSARACPAAARRSWRRRRHAAGAAVRPHRRRHRDDLVEQLGSTSITIQFDLSRNIDGAARDVEAAINAARTYLPANLPGNPTYRKVNPADAPIMILGLTSDKYGPGQAVRRSLDGHAAEALADQGVGQVNVGGGALPSVRVEVNPTQAGQLRAHDANLQSC